MNMVEPRDPFPGVSYANQLALALLIIFLLFTLSQIMDDTVTPLGSLKVGGVLAAGGVLVWAVDALLRVALKRRIISGKLWGMPPSPEG